MSTTRRDKQMATYEKPAVNDYGTLVELTAAGTQPNADVPHGTNDTAFSVGP